MPPSPICCNSLYGPMTVPGRSVTGCSSTVALGGGRSRKPSSFSWAARSSCTLARRAGSAPQAPFRYAARSAGVGSSRAARKIDCSGFAAGMVNSLSLGAGGRLHSIRRGLNTAGAKIFRFLFGCGDVRVRAALPVHRTSQPGTRVNPVAFDRAGGQAKQLGGLFHRQLGEVAQFHEFGQLGVSLGQSAQGFVEGQKSLVGGWLNAVIFLKFALSETAAMFQAFFAAGAIEEDAA